mgnify:CR=1 FL=1
MEISIIIRALEEWKKDHDADETVEELIKKLDKIKVISGFWGDTKCLKNKKEQK